MSGTAPSPVPSPRLSPRQREVLALLLTSVTEHAVAKLLQISPHTVHVYVKQVYRLHGVRSRAGLMALFIPFESRIQVVTGLGIEQLPEAGGEVGQPTPGQ